MAGRPTGQCEHVQKDTSVAPGGQSESESESEMGGLTSLLLLLCVGE